MEFLSRELCQALAISICSSAYFIVKDFSKERQSLKRAKSQAKLSKRVTEIENEQNEHIETLHKASFYDLLLFLWTILKPIKAFIQMRINVGILTDEMERQAKRHHEDMGDVLDEIDCLAQLIRAVGDSGEIETQDNTTRIDLVARDTKSQIEKLTHAVDRLKTILINADKLKLRDAINDAEETAKKLENAEAEKLELERQLGKVS